jgi:hypothetical protein
MAQVVVVMGVTTDVPLGLSACMVSVRDHQHMEYGANSLIRNSSVLEMCKSEANNMEVYEGHDSQALDTIDPGLRRNFPQKLQLLWTILSQLIIRLALAQ